MAVQLSVAVRNAMLDAYEVAAGTDVIMELRTGAQPANCAAASTGTLIASITCPTDWAAAAASGAKALAGVWSDAAANATGTIAHYRLFKSDTTTCFEQGTVTIAAGGGDVTLVAVAVTLGQTVTVSTKVLTAANA